MKVFAVAGTSELATVYMAETEDGKCIEFVESLQPPYPRNERWILMVSTLYGCPVRCKFCDAGGQYQGKPGAEEILTQIDYMVDQYFPDRRIPAAKFKIQFARMGEPALNMATLDALEALASRYDAPGLMPSISTIAPHGVEAFFDRLIEVKDKNYPNGRFQFQFSIHTTDVDLRNELIPVRKWDFDQMARYADRFLKPGDRKVTLNFALAEGMPLDPNVLLKHFDPNKFLVKITPVNPTARAVQNGLSSQIDPSAPESYRSIAEAVAKAGYEVIVSIGEVEENQIGSNCGQYVLNYLEAKADVKDGYTYDVVALERTNV